MRDGVLAAQQAVLVALRAHELRARSVPDNGDGAPSIYDACLRSARNALALARAGAARASSSGLVARARAVRLYAAAAPQDAAESALLLHRVRHFLTHRAPPEAVAAAMSALTAEMTAASARVASGRRTRPCSAASAAPMGPAFRVVNDGTLAACPICLCSYDTDDQARRCSSCFHLFHAACIDEWISTRVAPSCPLCRQPMARALPPPSTAEIAPHRAQIPADNEIMARRERGDAGKAVPAFAAAAAVGLGRFVTRRGVCSVDARSRAAVARQTPSMKVYDVEISLYGKEYTIPVDQDQTFLEGIEEYGLEVPYSCRAGVCITCAAKVIAGKVDLGEAAITSELKEEGYVLTCSGFPLSDGIKLEMNHFDDAYEKQYGQYENTA